MKLWQKILMASTAVIAVAAVVLCTLLVLRQRRMQAANAAAMDAANATLQQVQTERDDYRQQADAAKASDAEKQKQLDELQSKNSELEGKLKTEEEKRAAAEAEQQKLKDKNASLQQQIDLMTANKKGQGGQNTVKPSAGKVCYLTFDDGPSNVTPQVLATLKKYNVKATFFVIGNNNTETLKQIHADGHALALHCNDHTYSKVYASESAYFADLNAISKKVEDATGVKSMVVRFPGGSSNTTSRKYTPGLMTTLSKKLPEMGYAYFDWNVDSGDADGGYQSASTIASNVLNRAKGLDRICVLMHDGYGKQTTADALPAIIEGLQKQGYSFEVLTTEVTGFKHGINN